MYIYMHHVGYICELMVRNRALLNQWSSGNFPNLPIPSSKHIWPIPSFFISPEFWRERDKWVGIYIHWTGYTIYIIYTHNKKIGQERETHTHSAKGGKKDVTGSLDQIRPEFTRSFFNPD